MMQSLKINPAHFTRVEEGSERERGSNKLVFSSKPKHREYTACAAGLVIGLLTKQLLAVDVILSLSVLPHSHYVFI